MHYELPERFVIGSDAVTAVAVEDLPLWQRRWPERRVEIGVLTVALTSLTLVLVLHDSLVRHIRLFRIVRTGFLLFILVWTGWHAGHGSLCSTS
ncbi:MAG: hypothetical protein CMM46_16000 [Rhodospirillaceae bacterium]|nr:hypothetical protein [Rhodospirillaceae bacterium]